MQTSGQWGQLPDFRIVTTYCILSWFFSRFIDLLYSFFLDFCTFSISFSILLNTMPQSSRRLQQRRNEAARHARAMESNEPRAARMTRDATRVTRRRAAETDEERTVRLAGHTHTGTRERRNGLCGCLKVIFIYFFSLLFSLCFSLRWHCEKAKYVGANWIIGH